MLIDTARHYLPMSTLLTVLDSMAYSKLNVMYDPRSHRWQLGRMFGLTLLCHPSMCV